MFEDCKFQKGDFVIIKDDADKSRAGRQYKGHVFIVQSRGRNKDGELFVCSRKGIVGDTGVYLSEIREATAIEIITSKVKGNFCEFDPYSPYNNSIIPKTILSS